MPDPGARAVRGGRAAGQEGVPQHLEGDPGRQRGAAHAGQRGRHGRLRGAQDDAQQRVHDSQAERRGPGHAVPVAEAGQQHLGAPGAEAAARQPGGHAQPQVAHGRGRHLRIPGLRGDHQVVISRVTRICICCTRCIVLSKYYVSDDRDYDCEFH